MPYSLALKLPHWGQLFQVQYRKKHRIIYHIIDLKTRSFWKKCFAVILEILSNGNQSFMELNAALFPTTVAQFFPGCGIIENHILKLEDEGRISRRVGVGKIAMLDCQSVEIPGKFSGRIFGTFSSFKV